MPSVQEWRQNLLARFPDAKKSGKGYKALCPAHEDKSPSLTIYFTESAEGGKAHIKCRAGCEWSAVLAAAGIEKKELFFHPNGGRPQFKPKTIPKETKAFLDIDFDHPTKTYSYTDETGNELYQNCRYETDKHGNRLTKKKFRQRHKVQDKWAYSLNGLRRVPYNFPKLIEEPNIIFDCEGEKDAETLIKLGITATSTLKEAHGEFHKYCIGKGIIVCEDNDEPGRKKAQEKANAYWKAGAEFVKIFSFKKCKEGYDITDLVNEGYDVYDVNAMAFDLPIYNPLQNITIGFLREVTPRKPLLKIDNRNALPTGNLGGIVAGIGVGKSHFCEIIASSAIRPGCEPDSRIEVSLQEHERIAILDTEQPGDDCKEILYRIFRRTGQKPDDLTPDKNEFKRLSVISFIELEPSERREKLEMIIKRPEYKLIIIDGLLDMGGNPNDPVEAATLILWLHSMAAKHDKGIFCVLHGNRNDPTGKGKGWFGDVFQRKATCFLMVRKHKIDPTIRVITTDFDNVKFRHADDTGLNIAMQWDTDLEGFRCIPYPEEDEGKMTPQMVFEQCFKQAKMVRMKKKQLVTWYCQITGKATQTAYREIDKAVGIFLEKEKLQYSLKENDTL